MSSSLKDSKVPVLIGVVAIAAILTFGVVATYRLLLSDTKDSSVATPEASTSSSTLQNNSDIENATQSLDNDQLNDDLNPTQLDEDLTDLL